MRNPLPIIRRSVSQLWHKETRGSNKHNLFEPNSYELWAAHSPIRFDLPMYWIVDNRLAPQTANHSKNLPIGPGSRLALYDNNITVITSRVICPYVHVVVKEVINYMVDYIVFSCHTTYRQHPRISGDVIVVPVALAVLTNEERDMYETLFFGNHLCRISTTRPWEYREDWIHPLIVLPKDRGKIRNSKSMGDLRDAWQPMKGVSVPAHYVLGQPHEYIM